MAKHTHTDHEEFIALPRPERRLDARATGFFIGILLTLLLVTNADVVTPLFGSLDPFLSYRHQAQELRDQVSDLEKERDTLRSDRDLLKDASNVLLAIQEYYFTRGVFPESLSQLDQAKFLRFQEMRTNVSNPDQWYYISRGSDFVLCVYLSDEIRGVNTTACPRV